MTLNNRIVFFAAPPRTGSNLYSSILNQNSKIHSEGISPLCEVLWNIKSSIDHDPTKTSFLASYRDPNMLKKKFFSSIINDYYSDHKDKIIFDKNGSWSLLGNYQMIEEYIDHDPKVIVMKRNVHDIVKSYVNVYMDNGYSQEHAESELLFSNTSGSGILLRSLAGTMWAQMSKKNNFLFIDYEELINSPSSIIEKTYSFLQLDKFNHRLNDLVNYHVEDQSVIMKGLSEIRSEIKKRNLKFEISDSAKEVAEHIQKLINISEKENISSNEERQIIDFYNMSISS